ncbi:MAG: hypothetical protein FJ202_08435 [Gemmatimonadetes bacterium]|nr:hypothetical protein [Gemmatimonadota bacterium]
MTGSEADRVLEKLARDVEAAVHALYRGEVRQQTAKARTEGILRDARLALKSAVGAVGAESAAPAATSPRPPAASPALPGAAIGWSKDEGEAVMKCINAWLPMGPPRDAQPESKCIAAARELAPTWGQRERAREAVRRLLP